MIRSVFIAALAISAFPLGAPPAHAQDNKGDGGKGAAILGECSREAKEKGLKGEQRNQYLRDCNQQKRAAAQKGTPQQQRMRACNADAGKKGLQGDDRRKFISECLRG